MLIFPQLKGFKQNENDQKDGKLFCAPHVWPQRGCFAGQFGYRNHGDRPPTERKQPGCRSEEEALPSQVREEDSAQRSINVVAVWLWELAAAMLAPVSGFSLTPPPSHLCRSSDFPDLRKHNNCMASALTPAIYARLRDKVTPSNWTLDQCIQTGVDNPGHPFIKTVGCVAGDEESYEVGHGGTAPIFTQALMTLLCSQVFADLFDQVIKDRHNGYDPRTMVHPTDLDASKVLKS